MAAKETTPPCSAFASGIGVRSPKRLFSSVSSSHLAAPLWDLPLLPPAPLHGSIPQRHFSERPVGLLGRGRTLPSLTCSTATRSVPPLHAPPCQNTLSQGSNVPSCTLHPPGTALQLRQRGDFGFGVLRQPLSTAQGPHSPSLSCLRYTRRGEGKGTPRQPSPVHSSQLSITYALKNTTQSSSLIFFPHPLDSEGGSGGSWVWGPSATEPGRALPTWDQAALPENPAWGLSCPVLPAGAGAIAEKSWGQSTRGDTGCWG